MQHQIDKLQCKFEVYDRDLQNTLEQYIIKTYDYQLVNVINKVLNRFPIHLEIEQIQLSLPPIYINQLSNRYLSYIESALSEFLDQYVQANNIDPKHSTNDTNKYPEKKLLTYLDKGYFNTITKSDFNHEWNAIINSTPQQLITALSRISDFKSIQRLTNQLNTSELWKLVKKIRPEIVLFKAYYKFFDHILRSETIVSKVSLNLNHYFWSKFIYTLLSQRKKNNAQIIFEHFKIILKESSCKNVSSLFLAFSQFKSLGIPDNLKQYCLAYFLSDTTIGQNFSIILEHRLISEDHNLFQKLLEVIPPSKQELLFLNASITLSKKHLFEKDPNTFFWYKTVIKTIASTEDRLRFETIFRAFSMKQFIANRSIKNKENYVSNLIAFINKTNDLGYRAKEKFIDHIIASTYPFINRNRAFLNKKQKSIVNPFNNISKIKLALEFLLHGGISINYGNLSAAQMDIVFRDLFQQNNAIKWRQKYIDSSSNSKGIFSSVIENYLTQETDRVAYFIQLSTWHPLRKKEIYHFRQGTKRKQAKRTAFASSLATHLTIPHLDKVIGYIQPEYTSLIVHFVTTTVYVIKKESLTNKLIAFERAVYGFVLAFLLSESGYSFQKKRFIQNQIERISRYFNIEFQRTLEIFLASLEPFVIFGQTKQLFEILQELHSYTQTEHKKLPNTNSLKSNREINQTYEDKKEWLSRLAFFIESSYLKKTYNALDYKWLSNHIPLEIITAATLTELLNNDAIITSLRKELKRKNINISISDICQDLLHNRSKILINRDSISKEFDIIIKENLGLENWQEAVIYHLTTHKRIAPNLTLKMFKGLTDSLPIEEISFDTLCKLLEKDSIIKKFISSEIALHQSLGVHRITSILMHWVKTNKKIAQSKTAQWGNIFLCIVTQDKLPNNTNKTLFDTLLKEIIGKPIHYNNLYHFLKRHDSIHQFLKKDTAKTEHISLETLTSFIFRWVTSDTPISFKDFNQNIAPKVRSNNYKTPTNIKEWVDILIYYLKHDRFPNYIETNTLESFIDKRLDVVNFKTIHTLLTNEKALTDFLKSEIAFRKKLDLTSVSFLVLRLFNISIAYQKKQSKPDQQSIDRWVATLIYFLKNNKLPSHIHLNEFIDFIKSIPVTFRNYNSIYNIINSNKEIELFLSSSIAQEKSLTTSRISILVLEIIKSNNLVLVPKINTELTSLTKEKHWVAILFYYLEQQEIPWWSTFKSLDQLFEKAQLNQRSKNEILFYFKSNQRKAYIWYSLAKMANSKKFLEFIYQLIPMNPKRQKLFKDFSEYFGIPNHNYEKQIQQHLGIASKSHLFWKVVLLEHRLLTNNQSNEIKKFINYISKTLSFQNDFFYKSLISLFKEEGKESSSELIKQLSKIKDKQNKTLQNNTATDWVTQIQQQILIISKPNETTESTQNILDIFSRNPSVFISLLEKTVVSKAYTISQLSKLFNSWALLLFPKYHKSLISIFNEIMQLVEKHKKWDIKDLEALCLYLWRGKQRYNYIDILIFIEGFLYNQAVYRNIGIAQLYKHFLDLKSLEKLQVPTLKQYAVFNTSNKSELLETLKKEVKPSAINEVDIKEPILVPHSGLVLLWKFFIPLFKHFKLWNHEEEKYYDEYLKDKAIIVLLFLAKGSCEFEDEHELIIMKLLTGIPLDHVTTPITLTEEEQYLAEGLITNVISRWTQLGTCSIDGLRSSFLQRPALLTIEEEKTLLSFETTTTGIDMLLDFLPWTIGTIRLPWIEKDIITNWRDK